MTQPRTKAEQVDDLLCRLVHLTESIPWDLPRRAISAALRGEAEMGFGYARLCGAYTDAIQHATAARRDLDTDTSLIDARIKAAEKWIKVCENELASMNARS